MITLDSLDLENLSPQQLGELLISAKNAYYTTGKPIMDDQTYDILEDILKQKNPHHRIFKKVGNTNFDTGFPKKKHSLPMGSQNKVTNYADLVHYFKLKKTNNNTHFVVQPKIDGISLEIEYKNGVLIDAITRGDGFTGDVITQNVVRMQNLVMTLPKDFTGAIRCEIVVTYNDFKKLNSASAETKTDYSNPRNAVSGISQRLDGKFSEFCSLFAVDIKNNDLLTETKKIEFLKHLGFTPVETHLCQNFEQIESIYQEFLLKNRQNYPFEIDGLVVKINDLNFQHQLGSHNNRPKGQVAYKFPAASNQTQIKAISWQVGPMGAITPVAKVEPIELSGAVITFASLGNYKLVKQKNINLNDIVKISRRGDVIPHIEKVITKTTPGHAPIPANCPSCNQKLTVEDKFLRCSNTQNCLAQILGTIRLFCDVLEIKGISDKTIEKLYQAKKIRLPGDLYNLTVSDFVGIEGLGEKSGSNIVSQIQAKKELTLVQIFDAASVPNFSQARIKQLVKAGFDTPQKIINLTVSEIETLPGFKFTLAQKIIDGLAVRKKVIESILSHVNLKTPNSKTNQKLFGLSFCITGSLSQPRKKIEEIIEQNGGNITSSISQNTSYLLTNESESHSSKFLSAKKFGTKIITESELLKLIN